MSMSLSELIELGDPDELLREIDRRCASRDWDGLVELRERCHQAVERGKQLWGVAGNAEYRLALEAPGAIAASVVDANAGPFVLGPLGEVAASTHKWDELRDTLPAGPHRAIVAYECVARGADLSDEPDAAELIAAYELPLTLASWEPRYATALYKSHEVSDERPTLNIVSSKELETHAGPEMRDIDATDALAQLVAGWTDTSNGRAIVVAGDASLPHVLHALGVRKATAENISRTDALALMSWASANGGAHGRRTGAAAARVKTWWALAAVAGLTEDWPMDAETLARETASLEWWTWGEYQEADGWSINLAVLDLDENIGFAVHAEDRREQDSSRQK